jgi:hypothetical protein
MMQSRVSEGRTKENVMSAWCKYELKDAQITNAMRESENFLKWAFIERNQRQLLISYASGRREAMY